jgi:hypothetical protein
MKMSPQYWCNDIDRESKNIRRENGHNAILPTPSLTCIGLASNPGVRVEKSATNRPSHGMTLKKKINLIIFKDSFLTAQ